MTRRETALSATATTCAGSLSKSTDRRCVLLLVVVCCAAQQQQQSLATNQRVKTRGNAPGAQNFLDWSATQASCGGRVLDARWRRIPRLRRVREGQAMIDEGFVQDRNWNDPL